MTRSHTAPRTYAARAARGFTLMELLIVIAILLALGAIVAVNLIPRFTRSKVDIQKGQFDQVDTAMKLFRLDLDRWPTEDEGLAALWDRSVIEDEAEAERWTGPYLEDRTDQDQWDQELIYEVDGELYTIRSIGPDGEEGTDDDITNRKSSLAEEDEYESFGPAPTGTSGTGTTGG